MNTEPWILMSLRRQRLGMTQAALAEGIVSQSMICQIERGRVAPSTSTLRRLAERLAVDPEEWVKAWRHWRVVDDVQERLWAAVQNYRLEEVQLLLGHHAGEIPSFEECFYRALLEANEGNIRMAEKMLMRGWTEVFQLRPHSAMVKNGRSNMRRNVRKQRMDMPDGDIGTSMDIQSYERVTARCLAVEAMARVRIATACHRHAAAAVWRGKARIRLSGLQSMAPE